MPYTKEQAEKIKKQLLKEIEKIPNADHEQIRKYIESLNEEELEEFIKKNNLKSEESNEQEKPVFQMIVENSIPSYKIGENDQSIAILEINPLSKGHCIVLPKQKLPIEEIPKSSFYLAQKIAKKIKLNLKPLEVKIETFSFQDYSAINIIPIYKNIPLNKTKANEKYLKDLQKKLFLVKKPVIKEEMNIKELPEYRRKIPEFY